MTNMEHFTIRRLFDIWDGTYYDTTIAVVAFGELIADTQYGDLDYEIVERDIIHLRVLNAHTGADGRTVIDRLYIVVK